MSCQFPHATIQTALASAVSVSWPHQVTNEPSHCAPAENIENGPNSDGRTAIIASRCKRLRHANNVQRMRWLAAHRTLGRCSGEADA